MTKRISVRTPRGIRSIATYTQEELDRKGEYHMMAENQTTITTDFELTENDLLYKNGGLQGLIKDLLYYSITASKTLTTTETFYGGEEIIIIPWK